MGRKSRTPMARRCAQCTTLMVVCTLVRCDFMYDNFETTIGLVMNGDAATSSCDPHLQRNDVYEYNARHNASDHSYVGVDAILHESTAGGEVQTRTVSTNDASTTADMLRNELAFGHKDDFVAADPASCAVRVRLTPSEASKRGSVWHATQVAATRGFETSFKFHVSDLSRRCTTVRDPTFSTLRFQSCFVSGGDGFAFVLQNNPRGTASLGRRGEGIGAAGITNALVVEFDTWFNAVAASSSGGVHGDTTVGVDSKPSHDLFEDHIALYLTRPLPRGFADEKEYEMKTGRQLRVTLAPPRRHALSDGRIHTVTVRYYEGIQHTLVDTLTATPELVPLLRDGGEGRRVGTLAVWIDAHGVGSNETQHLRVHGSPLNTSKPLLAIPINLAAALELEEGTAWAGFTASTGNAWEKHDVLAWYYCEASDCKETNYGRPSSSNSTATAPLDYVQDNVEHLHEPYSTPTSAAHVEGVDAQPLSRKP